MILTFPVRKTVVRRNGVDVCVHELVPGFVRVLSDRPDENNLLGNGQEIFISNPLIEAFMNADSTNVGVGEKIFIVLDEAPHSNPGANDDGPSITHNAHSLT